VPHAHDQFDNAARVERLGCGRVLPRPRYNAESATRELRLLLEKSSYAEAAAKVGAVVREENGARVAAASIEKVLMEGEGGWGVEGKGQEEMKIEN
jgi:UDP:flavonoid glycosyltransferase YjiC (YdhE family)